MSDISVMGKLVKVGFTHWKSSDSEDKYNKALNTLLEEPNKQILSTNV